MANPTCHSPPAPLDSPPLFPSPPPPQILLDKWRALDVSHSLSVAFFTRMVYYPPSSPSPPSPSSPTPPLPEDLCRQLGVSVDPSDGCLYRDYFKMVVENEPRTEGPPDTLLTMLKREFLSFPRLLDWWLPLPPNESGPNVLWGAPAKASRGNFLEAINVTLNVLEKHYMDRDLRRTGNSILMISPGTGVMEVTSWLSGLTKQRMMDNGIGMDMLSLSMPPMHTVPLFICKDQRDQVRGHTGERGIHHFIVV